MIKTDRKISFQRVLQFLAKHNTVIIFIVMLVISAIVSDVFFTSANLFNLIRQVTPVGIISMGMLLVILTGGIDLSVGSIVAMTGVLCAIFTSTMSLPVAILLSLSCGILTGAVSGYLISVHKMAPFIVTLALMSIVRGSGFIFSKGAPVTVSDNASALTDFGSGSFLGFPNPAYIMILTFILTAVLLKYNVFGRIIIAIGSNEEAVRLSGIKVTAYKLSVYIICGGLSAIAGIITTARTSVGSPVMGAGMELDVIATVVIGGASLSGGKGTAVNTLLGVLILGMIGNIMNLINIPAYSQQIIKGLIIIIAVMLQRFRIKDS
ncbi:MAG TPA: ABC transporter permease [Bacteroidales bacterium]|jgi:ribose transport system permease protein|nr:ABC transporter permease [Bacteroidales bacterium]HPM86693.1 ABC transporter permease [Bacteroidales bacterium]HQM68362.1 ABC transporter permease [Bacteroidales bacterium]